MTDQPLADRTALVTGAARGIGAATARLLAERGAVVVLADVDVEAGAALATELGPAHRFVVLDVADEHSWDAVAGQLSDDGGPGVDVLVHSAGIAVRADLAGSDLAQFRRVLDVNLVGTYLALRTAARLVRDGGSVVTLSSVRGVLATSGLGAYGASKFGVRALTRVAALEFADRGIRCNSVCPGSIATTITQAPGFAADDAASDMAAYLESIPFRRQGAPEEVARVIAFLAGDESGYVTGTDVVVDGGTAAGRTIPRGGSQERPTHQRAPRPPRPTTR